MQTNLGWVFGPDANVLAAELKDGVWQASACGHGERACPACGTCATARHGWQHRRLQDLPVQGARVTLNLRLGRWRCRSPHCERQITAAALCLKPRDLLTPPQARKVEALKQASANFTALRRLAMRFRGIV